MTKTQIKKSPSREWLEKAFETYLPEERVHEELGNIHEVNDEEGQQEQEQGGESSNLSDKDILARYERLSLKDVPDNWREEHQKLVDNQEKHTDYDTIKSELITLRDNLSSFFFKYKVKGSKLSDLGSFIDDLKSRPFLDKDSQQKINDYDNLKIEKDDLLKKMNLAGKRIDKLLSDVEKLTDEKKELNKKISKLEEWPNSFKGKDLEWVKDKFEEYLDIDEKQMVFLIAKKTKS